MHWIRESEPIEPSSQEQRKRCTCASAVSHRKWNSNTKYAGKFVAQKWTLKNDAKASQ